MVKMTSQVKLAWLRGMESIGTAASNLASSARFKAQEIHLETRRREIMAQLGVMAFDLWQKGEKLPETLNQMLTELSALTEKLGVLQSLRYQAVESATEWELQSEGAGESHDDSEAIREAVTNAEEEALEALNAEGAQRNQWQSCGESPADDGKEEPEDSLHRG